MRVNFSRGWNGFQYLHEEQSVVLVTGDMVLNLTGIKILYLSLV
jgi:hypothetical protein